MDGAQPPPRRPPVEPLPQQGFGDFSAIVTVFFAFIIIASVVLIPSSSPNLKNSLTVLHQVPEGHVGVYWLGGALQKTTTTPGFHLKSPLITHYEPVQVTLQTDLVRDIPCGTKGGVMINFDRIEVVNRLNKDSVYDTLLNYGVQYDHTWIYDKIHHEINQFCSVHSLQEVYIDKFDQIDETMKDALQADCTRYAPGIEIISVRVTKPRIPESVRRNFEQMEEERTKSMDAEVTLKLGSTSHKREQYRLMRDAMGKRFIRITRGSIVGRVRLGIFSGAFYGLQSLLAEKRGVHDVYNVVAAGSTTAATFGLIMPGSLAWRGRNVLLGSVLGATVCFPLGWLHLKLVEKANEESPVLLKATKQSPV